jgi:hypothetical protein
MMPTANGPLPLEQQSETFLQNATRLFRSDAKRSFDLVKFMRCVLAANHLFGPAWVPTVASPTCWKGLLND